MATASVGGRGIYYSAFSIRRLLNLTEESGQTEGGHRDDLAGDSAGNQRVVNDDMCGDKSRQVTISANKSEGGFVHQKSDICELSQTQTECKTLRMFDDYTDVDEFNGRNR